MESTHKILNQYTAYRTVQNYLILYEGMRAVFSISLIFSITEALDKSELQNKFQVFLLGNV